MLGRSHPLVRRLRLLRRDREQREAEGVFIAEGIHLAQEAIEAGAAVELAIVAPRLTGSAEGRELRRHLEDAGIALHEAADGILDSLQDARSPQPVLLVVRRRGWSLRDVLDGSPGPALLAVVCGVQDPGNLGSILRTTDAAGGTGLVQAAGGADLHHPRAVRATMGSIFRLAATECGLEDLLNGLRTRGIVSIGAVAAASLDYHRCDLTRSVALFLGSEGAGLPQEIRDRLDVSVRIPIRQGVESLSVGAAAAILLFEARRQRAGSTSAG